MDDAIRIPFPCHSNDAWAIPETTTSLLVYKQCPCCKRVYEINPATQKMRQMIPLDAAPPYRQLMEHIRTVLERGDDVVIRRTGKQGIKVRGTNGYNEWASNEI